MRSITALADGLHIQVDSSRHEEDINHDFSYANFDWPDDRADIVQPVHIQARQGVLGDLVIPGALAPSYDIPTVIFRSRWAFAITVSVTLIVSSALWRLRSGALHLQHFLILIAPLLGFRAFGWMLSCLDRPKKVTADQQSYLDQLYVTISIPCFNEDPSLLDRALFSLANQTRRPDHVEVVNDGSTKVDYSELEDYWTQFPWLTWTRKRNEGKRRAHCTTFAKDGQADIFVTLDSDTALVLNALEEGLKPFAESDVQSVAGVELGFNANHNFLTVMQNSLQQIAQAVVAAAWSVTGNMFTNRGPFALYRAPMIRSILNLYGNEMFYGHRVVLGDDSLLALAGSVHGRSVQQLSAFGLTMWPENMSHHLRQRVRWARGRTIRNFWRLKYYPIGSYIWWFTVINTYGFMVGFSIVVRSIGDWHMAGPLFGRMVLTILLFSWISQLRVLCFKRSDETWLDRVLLIAIRPIASIWASFVLTKCVRLIGTFTCLRQGWTTRQNGAENFLEAQGATI